MNEEIVDISPMHRRPANGLYLTGAFVKNIILRVKSLTGSIHPTGEWERTFQFFLQNIISPSYTVQKKRAFVAQENFAFASLLLRHGFELVCADDEDYVMAIEAVSLTKEQVNNSGLIICQGKYSLVPVISRISHEFELTVLGNGAKPDRYEDYHLKWLDVWSSQNTSPEPPGKNLSEDKTQSSSQPEPSAGTPGLSIDSGKSKTQGQATVAGKKRVVRVTNRRVVTPPIPPTEVLTPPAPNASQAQTVHTSPGVQSVQTEHISTPKNQGKAPYPASCSSVGSDSDFENELLTQIESFSTSDDLFCTSANTFFDNITQPQEATIEIQLPVKPDEDFWKDQIRKLLVTYVEGYNGCVSVDQTIFWLYSLQLNADLSSLSRDDIDLSETVCTIIRDNLPSSIRWMEDSPDTPARLLSADHPDVQPVSAQEAANQLQIGAKVSEVEPITFRTSPLPSIDHIIEGSGLLEQFCQWSVERAQKINRVNFQEEIVPNDKLFTNQGKILSVNLWPIHNPVERVESFNQLAECYRLVKFAFSYLRDFTTSSTSNESKAFFHKAVQLAADAQCLLKSCIISINYDIGVDPLLNEAFKYLNDTAKERSFFLYHFKNDDILPMSEVSNVWAQIEQQKKRYAEFTQESKRIRKMKLRLQYHLQKVEKGEAAVDDWNKIISSATSLCEQASLTPSDLFFRECLDGIIAKIPEDVEITDTFGRIVQEIELYHQRLEEQNSVEEEDQSHQQVIPPLVQRVRDKYEGSKMVFIGGEPKDHIINRIKERFGVDLIWSPTNHGESLSRFDGVLNDPKVSLFLIYIPWCSHKHSEELSQKVLRAGKEVVRLRKGTNPDVIANTICQQVRMRD